MSNNPYLNTQADSDVVPQGPRLLKVVVRLVVICLAVVVVAMLFVPFTRTASHAARRMACSNNLKQIGLALLNYQDQYGTLPPAYTVDSEGHRLHSWRTLILPYIEHSALYDQIDLTKPWNDPVNATLFQLHLSVYGCPQLPGSGNQTAYLAVVDDKAALRPWDDRSNDENAHAKNKAIMVVEVPLARAINWMEPVDVKEHELRSIFSMDGHLHAGGTNVLCNDGGVIFISEGADVEQMLEMRRDNGDAAND